MTKNTDPASIVRRIASWAAPILGMPFSLRLWDGTVVPLAAEAPVTCGIAIKDPGFARAMLRKPSLDTLFRAYAHGDIEPFGVDLLALYEIIHERRKAMKPDRLKLARTAPWRDLARLALMPAPPVVIEKERAEAEHGVPAARRDDKAFVQFHYDAGNEFYKLFLDERMVYSCAYFKDWSNGIDQAQEDKLELICRKLRLKAGERFLDIGCGWGALMFHAVLHHGVTAHGATLSQAQHDYVRWKARELAIADRVTVELKDFRDLEGQFDKIASVGMYEHVGIDNYKAYFRKLASLMTEDGVLLNHGITRRAKSDAKRFRKPSETRRIILKYIFPGAELDHIGHTLEIMEACGLEIHDVEGLRRHYGRTCRLWYERLSDQRERGIEAVGVERFRMWQAYLAGVTVGFEKGPLRLFQIVATRQGATVIPPTRADLYERP